MRNVKKNSLKIVSLSSIFCCVLFPLSQWGILFPVKGEIGSSQVESQWCTHRGKNTSHWLPWWSSGKESAINAGDMGLIPSPGRLHIPCSNQACEPQLLSLCSRTQESKPLKPVSLVPVLCNKRSCSSEKQSVALLNAKRKNPQAAKTQLRGEKKKKFTHSSPS